MAFVGASAGVTWFHKISGVESIYIELSTIMFIEAIRMDKKNKSAEQKNGIGGWLAFFVFSIIASGVLEISILLPSMVSSLNSTEYAGIWKYLIFSWLLFYSILLISLRAYIVYCFSELKPNAIGLSKILLIIILMDSLIFSGGGRGVFYFIIWFLYLTFSKRVEATFPKRKRKFSPIDKYFLIVGVAGFLLIILIGAFAELLYPSEEMLESIRQEECRGTESLLKPVKEVDSNLTILESRIKETLAHYHGEKIFRERFGLLRKLRNLSDSQVEQYNIFIDIYNKNATQVVICTKINLSGFEADHRSDLLSTQSSLILISKNMCNVSDEGVIDVQAGLSSLETDVDHVAKIKSALDESDSWVQYANRFNDMVEVYNNMTPAYNRITEKYNGNLEYFSVCEDYETRDRMDQIESKLREIKKDIDKANLKIDAALSDVQSGE